MDQGKLLVLAGLSFTAYAVIIAIGDYLGFI